jgi:hypothetical protein
MARILVGETELDVSEDAEEILARIVDSRDGLRHGSGAIVAPPGWVSLSQLGLGAPVFVQVSRIGYVREG